MATKTLEENVNQAVNDFNAIKSKIIESGVDVPKGTPTSAYSSKVEAVYQKGADDTAEDVSPLIVEQSNRLAQCFDEDFPDGDALYNEIYNEGHKDGRQAEYDEFWDAYQNYGKRTNYLNAFRGAGWTDITYKPKYPIGDNARSVDFGNLFVASLITDTIVDIRANASDVLGYTFVACYALKTVRKLCVSETTQYIETFGSSTALENLTIEGTIAQNGFNTSFSPLNKASLTSIVNALSSTTTGLTVTLRLSAVNSAFETAEGLADGSTSEEWLALAATKSNWTISLINS